MALRKTLNFSVASLFKQVIRYPISTCVVRFSGTHPGLFTRVAHPSFYQTAALHTYKAKGVPIQQKPAEQEIVIDTSKEDYRITKDIISKVNEAIEEKSYGRLFAVVHVCGKQFKVTAEDLIVVEGYWAPTVGDKLKLDKVLLAGGLNFTLIGRPVLSPELVSVEATVIEKNMSHTRTHFRKKRRKQYMRINFYRAQQTMLRINSIEIIGKVNEKKDVEGLDGRIF